MGHRVVKFVEGNDGPGVWVCLKCGHYGQQRLIGLYRDCLGKKSKQLATLRSFSKGKHPKTGRPLTRVADIARIKEDTGILNAAAQNVEIT